MDHHADASFWTQASPVAAKMPEWFAHGTRNVVGLRLEKHPKDVRKVQYITVLRSSVLSASSDGHQTFVNETKVVDWLRGRWPTGLGKPKNGQTAASFAPIDSSTFSTSGSRLNLQKPALWWVKIPDRTECLDCLAHLLDLLREHSKQTTDRHKRVDIPSQLHALRAGHCSMPAQSGKGQGRCTFLSNKKQIGAPGTATRSKDAIRGSWPCC